MGKHNEAPTGRSPLLRGAGLIPLALLLLLAGALAGPGPARAGGPSDGTETKIEIKVSGTVSEDQRAQIDKLLQAFRQQNPRLKIKTERREKEERESKTGKYHFYPLTAAMLGAVGFSTLLAQAWRRARYGIGLLGNVATAAAFALVAASGFLLIFGIKMEHSRWEVKYWHVIIGTVFVYLILFHLLNNWRVWLSYGRRLGRALRGLGGRPGC